MNYEINKLKCIGCSYCRMNCNFDSIAPAQFSNIMDINPDTCTNCGICIGVCPVDAISYCQEH